MNLSPSENKCILALFTFIIDVRYYNTARKFRMAGANCCTELDRSINIGVISGYEYYADHAVIFPTPQAHGKRQSRFPLPSITFGYLVKSNISTKDNCRNLKRILYQEQQHPCLLQ